MYIEGIDVSEFQTGADYEKVKASGREFVYIKASDGATPYIPAFHKKHFLTHRETAGPHLWMGAYHVLKPQHDIKRQADNFYKQSGGLGEMRMQLPPAIDFELFGPPKAVPLGELAGIALDTLRATEELFSCTPVLYTYPWFIARVIKASERDVSELGRFPLWFATYGEEPSPPEPWDRVTIWQYKGDNGSCPGVKGACDLNRFLGSRTELRKFMGDPGPFPDDQQP